MPDLARYKDHALIFDTESIPFEPGSLELLNDAKKENIFTGTSLKPDLIQVLVKKPGIRVTLLDPSLIPDWTVVPTDIATVVASWLAFEQDGGLGSTYETWTMTKGVIVPVTLNAAVDRKATLDVLCLATFDTGNAVTKDATAQVVAAVTKAYYPTSITVGGGEITQLININVNWDFQIQDDDQVEPDYYYYDARLIRGTAIIKDLAQVTAARLEDGATETVVILLTDANDSANTLSIDLAECKIFSTIKGDQGTIEFEQVTPPPPPPPPPPP